MKVLRQLLTGIREYLKRPKSRAIYAATTGQYLGKFFVYMEERNRVYIFLSMPDMTILEIPVDSFDYGIKCKVIDIVEILPRKVFEVCQAQYRNIKIAD